MLADAQKLTSVLNAHGYFVRSPDEPYFFDQDQHKLIEIHKDSEDLDDLMGERYSVNRKDQFFEYVIYHLRREARFRGREALIRRFSYYDQKTNQVYLDQGDGRVLRIGPHAIDLGHNGQDGLLFVPVLDQAPWEYQPPGERRPLYDRIVANINFTDEGSTLGIRHQRWSSSSGCSPSPLRA